MIPNRGLTRCFNDRLRQHVTPILSSPAVRYARPGVAYLSKKARRKAQRKAVKADTTIADVEASRKENPSVSQSHSTTGLLRKLSESSLLQKLEPARIFRDFQRRQIGTQQQKKEKGGERTILHNIRITAWRWARRMRKWIRRSRYNFAKIQNSKLLKNLWDRSKAEHFLLWIYGLPRQHFGPKCRLPDLFCRRDAVYLHLSTQALRWRLPPPRFHHDIFDVASKVFKVERTIDYVFTNRLLCVEALKLSGLHSPLYFDGSVVPIVQNNRLALLGDRVLSLAMCEMWFRTGNTTKAYSQLDQDTATRASLAVRGRALGFHESIILPSSMRDRTARPHQIAETFEAILGAVYADSGNDLEAVRKVFKTIGLDQHRVLEVPEGVKRDLERQRHQQDFEGSRSEEEERQALVEEHATIRKVVSSAGG